MIIWKKIASDPFNPELIMEFVTQKEQLTRIDAHQSAQNRSQTITSSASIKALMNILTELLVPMWRKETYLLFISHFARRLGIHQKKDANEHLFFLHKIFFPGKKGWYFSGNEEWIVVLVGGWWVENIFKVLAPWGQWQIKNNFLHAVNTGWSGHPGLLLPFHY